MLDAEGRDLGPVVVEELTGERSNVTLEGAQLSEPFGPFLSAFAREATGVGGTALLARAGGSVVGLAVTDPAERTTSLFTRSVAVAQRLREELPTHLVYAEVDLGGPRDVYGVFVAELSEPPPVRLRHAATPLTRDRRTEVVELLREIYGGEPARWLAAGDAVGERCFGVDLDGRLAAVGWLLLARRSARLHTLTVRPGYRRLGLANDLVAARLLYARRAGAVTALSEISERNAASRAAAERSGMRARSSVFLFPPPAGSPRSA